MGSVKFFQTARELRISEHRVALLARGKRYAEKKAEEWYEMEQRAQNKLLDVADILDKTWNLLLDEKSARELTAEELAGTQESCRNAEAAARQAQTDKRQAEEGRESAKDGWMRAEITLRKT